MNHNGSLLRTLYNSASGKYLKLRIRLEKARQSGRFYTLSKRKQHSLIHRLNRLFERLRSLQTQLRLSGIGAAIALAMASTSVEAQSSLGPYVREDSKNPLPPPSHIALPKPVSVDIDDDGDLDVFVGDKYGNIHFFRNTAGADQVRRLAKEEVHALDFVNVNQLASPAFIDVDADGDFDLLVGNSNGSTYFFRNTGTATEPEFEEQVDALNPFDGITGSVSKYGNVGPALPSFVDIDNDSDVDLIIGGSFSYEGKYSFTSAVEIYYNEGGDFNLGDNSVLSELNYGSRRSVTFVDLDGDGDLDILTGRQSGDIQAFIKNGSYFVGQYGAWNPATNTGNPFYNFYVYGNSWPNLVDLDDDGDLDALVGSGSNYSTAANTDPIRFFENTGDFVFEERTGLNLSPFDGVDVSEEATPTFTDIDGDGDLDAILGSKYSLRLRVYKNINGFFELDLEDPLADVNMWDNTLPVFVDIDGDGDQDLFVTSDYDLKFFENDDNSFSETTSPLDISSFDRPSVTFIDIDNDGDLDSFVFDQNSYSIEFFRNAGDAENPDFQLQTAPEPFNSLDIDYVAKITAVDIDHDGDLDMVISQSDSDGYSYYTRFRAFDNAGDGSFNEITPSPFTAADEEILGSKYSFLSLADVDGDGDLDLFLGYGEDHSGLEGGTVRYFENQNPAPVTIVGQSSVSVSFNTAVRLDPDLSIDDADNDDIVRATVTISDFSAGNEELDFTPSAGVTGEFEDGVLTITGKATLEEYETILQSVTYEATGNVTAARQSARGGVPAKTVTFSVRDTDFTETVVSVVSIITLDITGEFAGIVVYNAVSPGVTPGENDFMRIDGLPGDNEVTIFNRWGDQVFKTSGYNNNTKRFDGKNDNGKDLPSGTYFYTIEVSGKTITGYLSLKR